MPGGLLGLVIDSVIVSKCYYVSLPLCVMEHRKKWKKKEEIPLYDWILD